MRMVPASDRDRTLSAWHLQVESLVRFMIERGGRIGFGQFLDALRQDAAFDKAVGDAFAGPRLQSQQRAECIGDVALQRNARSDVLQSVAIQRAHKRLRREFLVPILL